VFALALRTRRVFTQKPPIAAIAMITTQIAIAVLLGGAGETSSKGFADLGVGVPAWATG